MPEPLFDVIRAFKRGVFTVQRVGVSEVAAQELVAKRARSYAASNGLDYAVPHRALNVLGRTACPESKLHVQREIRTSAEGK